MVIRICSTAFDDTHGGHCAICVGEAIDAGRMYEEGTPVDQIRDALRARYERRRAESW